MEFIRNHKTVIICLIIVTLMLGVLTALAYHFYTNYHVTTVYVDGNTHYSDDEIRDIVMSGFLGDNSMFLSLKYKNKSIENVPFVSKMSVKIENNNTIRIKVYEKATAGFVEYLDNYMYFDKDGVVIESSDCKTEGIPLVTGLDFDYVVIHERLPVNDPDIFDSILSITQLVNKYNLMIDKIHFGKDGSLTLYFDDVRVTLGKPEDLDEKIMKLQYMLPELNGKKGTLRMENYTEETKNISFEPEKEKENLDN